MKMHNLLLHEITLKQKGKELLQVEVCAINKYEALNWLLDSSNSSCEAYEDFRELIKAADSIEISALE